MNHNRKAGIHYWRHWLLLALLMLAAGCGEQRFEPLQAQDFTLPRLSTDEMLSLHDTRGDVVYITFWASWCAPCRQEMPYLAQIWERHHEEGFQVLAINVDEDVQLAREFVAEYQLPFPILRDADRAVSALYRVPGYPTHYVVDRLGDIRFSGLGFNINDVTAIGQEVVTLLAESADAAD